MSESETNPYAGLSSRKLWWYWVGNLVFFRFSRCEAISKEITKQTGSGRPPKRRWY